MSLSLKHAARMGGRLALFWGIMVLFALPVVPQSDWPQYQGNAQHIGVNPTAQITPPLELAWSRELCETALAQPTVVGGRVYVTTTDRIGIADEDAQLWCLSVDDGRVLWHQAFGKWPICVMQTSYAYGMLYLQVDRGFQSFVAAITPDSGHPIWVSGYRTQGNDALAPTVYNGKVVSCGNTYGGMYCFDAYTGEFQWKNRLRQVFEYTPAMYMDKVYAFVDEHYYICDLNTGAIEFTCTPETDSSSLKEPVESWDVGNSPVVDTTRNIIYLTSDRSLFAYDLETNEKLWEKRGDWGTKRATPALYDGRLYALHNRVLKVFDGLTGDSLDAYKAPEIFHYNSERPPVIANGFIFLSTLYKLYALDAHTLEEVWAYGQWYVCGNLAIEDDHLFVAASGTMYAFTSSPTGLNDEDSSTLPHGVALHQNYPNPFNTGTVISYDLPTRSHVEVTIFNILGRTVTTLLSGLQPAGSHSVEWNGTDNHGHVVSSGTYLYQITADDFVETRKMVLLK